MHVRKQVMVMPQRPSGALLALAVVATMSVVVAVAPPPNIVFILADGETMHSSLGATCSKPCMHALLDRLLDRSVHIPSLRPHHSCTLCLSLIDPYASIDSPRAQRCVPCVRACVSSQLRVASSCVHHCMGHGRACTHSIANCMSTWCACEGHARALVR
jgi:hypothetical protein